MKLSATEAVIFALTGVIIGLFILVMLNLDEVARESGHLVKLYWQAQH